MNLAIISPNQNAYSETFIQAHKNIPGISIKFYFGGIIPNELEGKGLLVSNKYSDRILFILKRMFSPKVFTYREEALIYSLKKEKIQYVLAEYGPTGVAMLPYCKKLHLPLFVHFHGYDAYMYEIIEKHADDYKKMFDYASAVVAVSRAMEKKLISLGCNPEKIHYTPCAPRDEFFNITPDFSKKQFVGLGRFVDKKAPYYTILAFRKVLDKHPDARLIIGGDGPLYNTCKNLLKYLNISDKVVLPGIITPDDFIGLLKHSLAFVQHSITAENGDMEGTPVGVSEASAAGLPVISTFHAGIPDVILHNETGLLVEEYDVDGMAEYMQWVLDNPEEAQKMGKKGRERIKENFTMEKHLGVLRDIVCSFSKNALY